MHQDGREFLEQCAKLGELLVGRGDGKARRHRVALPPGAVPAPDEIAAVGDGSRRRREQSGRAVAVHDGIAGDHAGVALMRGGEQSFGRSRMSGAIGDRCGGAVARQFVEKEFGVARGMRRIGEFLLLDEGVFLQPFEQLRAVGRDHLGLRKMDMRVDEARHDQRAGVMLHPHPDRQPRRQFVRRPDRFDAAVLHQDDAVVDVAITLRVAGAARRAQEGQKPAANGTHAQLKPPLQVAMPRASLRRRAGGEPRRQH